MPQGCLTLVSHHAFWKLPCASLARSTKIEDCRPELASGADARAPSGHQSADFGHNNVLPGPPQPLPLMKRARARSCASFDDARRVTPFEFVAAISPRERPPMCDEGSSCPAARVQIDDSCGTAPAESWTTGGGSRSGDEERPLALDAAGWAGSGGGTRSCTRASVAGAPCAPVCARCGRLMWGRPLGHVGALLVCPLRAAYLAPSGVGAAAPVRVPAADACLPRSAKHEG